MQETLKAAGLHKALADTYVSLLNFNNITPAKLATVTKQTRTNTYKLLDELVYLELATKIDINKKLHFKANSPTRLLVLARERLDILSLQEKQIKTQLPTMLEIYYKNNEQPSIRFFIGKNGIKEIYLEQIKESKSIWFLKTRADIEFFGFKFMHYIRNLAPKANISRKVFYPDSPEVPINTEQSDKKMLLERTWYNQKDYTAPVEWSVYGNKVSIISFGKEAIGTVIDSPQIAESLKQIFNILDKGLKQSKDYKTMPKYAEYTNLQDFVLKYNNTIPKDNN